MISTLEGIVSEKLGGVVVISVNGMGYGVLVTGEDFGKLAINSPFKVYIYEHIRENSHDLFGFLQLATMELFEELINVNGVGPKMALSVLSAGTVDDVRTAIASGDVKYIQSAPGVGKRLAERIIVDLKDKIGVPGMTDLDSILASDQMTSKDEAIAGLISLGYSLHDAATALKGIDKELPTGERIKAALKKV
ncbi:MAG TPA: Holliday junction branch migration protein RuvA [Candidatus Saccharimonadales bacterium]|jgi:Holliday junction DNA helicase RuvA|nr:Holliday junction branch migration protein RuvA [Candidatus Saccharimonadales bacterium]